MTNIFTFGLHLTARLGELVYTLIFHYFIYLGKLRTEDNNL